MPNRRRKQLSTTSLGSRRANRIRAPGNSLATSGRFTLIKGILSMNTLPLGSTPKRRTAAQ